MTISIRMLILGLLVCGASRCQADILLPGHKSVQHKLVFEPSDSLSNHRIVAAPIAGFSGYNIVEAGKPFPFSSKYGTRFYLVPESVVDLPKFDREVYEQWPSALPPCSEIKSTVVSSPLASALTTVQLVGIDETGPEVKLIKHEEFDRNGRLVSEARKAVTNFAYVAVPVGIGVAICGYLVIQRKRQGSRSRGKSVA